jgi:DNA (cytosine-5)-methyltransferase 1
MVPVPALRVPVWSLRQPLGTLGSTDELPLMRFIDLFAGLGGFHAALHQLGHECVFVSEINDELREIYAKNFPTMKGRIVGDVRDAKNLVPAHDILCAGFPCQPFSKSGAQLGLQDETRGTLFHEILEILQKWQPRHVILENVGNFERHDYGRTWAVVRSRLGQLGYAVRGTEHIGSGGHGLISPHHFGYPHTRERFYIVASLDTLPFDPFPLGNRKLSPSFDGLVQPHSELSDRDTLETQLTAQQVECINLWNELIQAVPPETAVPGYPIWGDEMDATYPYEGYTPYAAGLEKLRELMPGMQGVVSDIHEALLWLPRYARTHEPEFPEWKVDFIRRNRNWFREIEPHIPLGWKARLKKLPPSLRKLEWNCQGEERDLWKYVLQFRPSGLRTKRYSSIPALVAMTTTQIPILGPERRFLTRSEGLRLQGFSDRHVLPRSYAAAFAALGNAVHVGVVREIARWLLETTSKAPRWRSDKH